MNFDQARAVLNKSIGEYHTVVEPRLRELEAALAIAIEAQNEINAAPAKLAKMREELAAEQARVTQETYKLGKELAELGEKVERQRAHSRSIEEGQKEKAAAAEAEQQKQLLTYRAELKELREVQAELRADIANLEKSKGRMEKAAREILQGA